MMLERSSDGFEVADTNLQQHGPGEYLGTRQVSPPVFRAANLVRDADALEEAREEADRWLAEDPDLTSEHSAELRRALVSRWGDRLRLAEVG
jgi:ATP-dependent DNA helicase RecG